MLDHRSIVIMQAQRHCTASASLLQLQAKPFVSNLCNLSTQTAPGQNEALTAEQLQHC